MIQMNPGLCVRQIQGNPFTLIRGWRPLALGLSTTVEKESATPVPTEPLLVTARERPRRGLAKAVALILILAFAAVVNLSLWGASRVEQQRRTYRVSQQLRKSEARSHLLAIENRSVNAFLAVSEARVNAVGVVAASSSQNSKPLRRNKI